MSGHTLALRDVGIDVAEPDGSTRRLFHRLTASVESGQITAITGPSGTGKSTLLRAVCRFRDLTTGTISLDGVDIDSIPVRTLRRQVTLVPQAATALTPTVLRELRVGNPRLSDREAEELLEIVGIEKLRDHDTERLSGGELQRLCFARALAISPAFVLADESTASLDDRSKRQVESALTLVAARGTGIVIVSHDLDQVERIATSRIDLGAYAEDREDD